MEKIRIQKYFSEAGVMSRRTAENEIAAGHVSVNGMTAKLGDKIDPDADTVMWNGREVSATVGKRIYIMLNKPVGVVSTMSDERGRKCVAELVSSVGARVFPIGRLDMYSDGLLLMTNDGDAAHRAAHPSGGGEKIYRVSLSGEVSDDKLAALASPVTITERDGGKYTVAPCPTRRVYRDSGKTVVEMTLHEGRNRQIRRMCEALDLKIMRLTRISECGIALGSLPTGSWRYLKNDEIKKLLRM